MPDSNNVGNPESAPENTGGSVRANPAEFSELAGARTGVSGSLGHLLEVKFDVEAVLGRTVLNHMVTKRWRLDRKHQLGATGADGQQVDAALVAVAMAAPVVDQDLRQDAQELLSAQLVPQRVQRGALMVLLGFKTREISERIGAPREVVAWLRSELKEAAQGLK